MTAPTRYIALLRAINVGGHTVKMQQLRALFEAQGYTNVTTYIASGNVIFHAPKQDTTRLAARIETHLHTALGYAVATFIRTPAELAAIAAYQPFPPDQLAAATAFNVAFLAAPLTVAAQQAVLALTTAIDAFHIHEREVYWLCRTRQSESKFSNTVLEKASRQTATLRTLTTVRKLAALYAPAP